MKPTKKQVLVFGYGLSLILCLFAGRWLMKGFAGALPWVMFIFAAALSAITAIRWQKIIPFYERWMVGVRLVGQVVTTVILTVFYYCIFGTIGIVLRLADKDMLARQLQPQKSSYWIKRQNTVFERERYTQQF